MFRRPIRLDPASTRAALELGPPQPLHASSTTDGISLSADGRLLAVAALRRDAILFDLEAGTKTILGKHPGIQSIAISPDGQWVATAPRVFELSTVKIWDARRGTFARDLPGYSTIYAHAVFSGQGRWLGIGSHDDYRLWEVGSWQQKWVIPKEHAVGAGSPLAFTTDEKLLAIAPSSRLVRLLDPATGQEFASLQAPVPEEISWLAFSPDGCQLAACSNRGVIQVWDLRRIREGLAALGLDWDQPPEPPARPSQPRLPVPMPGR